MKPWDSVTASLVSNKNHPHTHNTLTHVAWELSQSCPWLVCERALRNIFGSYNPFDSLVVAGHVLVLRRRPSKRYLQGTKPLLLLPTSARTMASEIVMPRVKPDFEGYLSKRSECAHFQPPHAAGLVPTR